MLNFFEASKWPGREEILKFAYLMPLHMSTIYSTIPVLSFILCCFLHSVGGNACKIDFICICFGSLIPGSQNGQTKFVNISGVFGQILACNSHLYILARSWPNYILESGLLLGRSKLNFMTRIFLHKKKLAGT